MGVRNPRSPARGQQPGPGSGPLGSFAVAFATFTLQQLVLWVLGWGWQRPWLAVLFGLVWLPSNLAATIALFGRRSVGFQVTPKGVQASVPTGGGPPASSPR
jgi:hypothetical protein